ncbi:MAG: peptidoglycan bridge formation glycyltransferase FemA/FemB family protein [Candidatus Beckwithbacteria bacterium]|nr:peptidoglycan bridge formation glycyltransferase FemA/FemB family protein [Candidatus Beckwithbacteria bacterium]
MKETDLRQSREYAQYMKALGWQTEAGALIKKLPFVPWSFIKIQRQKRKIDFDKMAKKYRALQIKIEPPWGDKTDYGKFGFRPDNSPMLPTKTTWLDLTKSERQLLKEMHYKTRYNIKKFSIRQLADRFSMISGDKITENQLREFYEIYRKNYQKQKFWGLNFNQLKCLLKAFKLKSYLLTIKNLGGLIILVHNSVVYYSHNASTQEGRQKFAPTILIWQAIKLAKKLCLKRFDFEGINDKRWPGFTRFKRSFGGKEIEYRGSLSKWYLCI